MLTRKLPQLITPVVLLAALLSGCSSGDFPVRPVSGTVVCDGQAVTKGTITFTPLGEGKSLETGKPASAAIAQDGSFKLSTYDRFDGAIVGKHRVEFTGSEGEEDDDTANGDDQAPTAKKPARTQSTPACALDKELIVEVKSSGENVFKIELTKKK
jgi:hypothetical protein